MTAGWELHLALALETITPNGDQPIALSAASFSPRCPTSLRL
jgi:hypothetical protein